MFRFALPVMLPFAVQVLIGQSARAGPAGTPSAAPIPGEFHFDQRREPIAVLDGLVRFQTGDDPRWPEPGYDDSAWALLSPYLDGEEIVLENSLPPGLAANAAYPETQLQLPRGARLTLLTDGVVETQSPAKELFGFERTAAISTESAEKIAQAAQQFGQEDDITVLTLQFSPAEVMHA